MNKATSVLILAVAATAFVVVVKAEPSEQCKKMFMNMMPHGKKVAKCCKDFEKMEKKEMNEDLMECFGPPPKDGDVPPPGPPPHGPPPCDREMCLAKKLDTLDSDGKVDKEKMLAQMKMMMSPEAVATVEEHCLNGDLDQYAPKEFCELIKLKHCMATRVIGICAEWDDDELCKGIKADVDACISTLS